MKSETSFSIEDFEYDLDAELIAQKPLDKKDHSRLFVVDRNSSNFEHRQFFELPNLLRKGDVLVVNDTRCLNHRVATFIFGKPWLRPSSVSNQASAWMYTAMTAVLPKLKL
jgi:hypothetical protein